MKNFFKLFKCSFGIIGFIYIMLLAITSTNQKYMLAFLLWAMGLLMWLLSELKNYFKN